MGYTPCLGANAQAGPTDPMGSCAGITSILAGKDPMENCLGNLRSVGSSGGHATHATTMSDLPIPLAGLKAAMCSEATRGTASSDKTYPALIDPGGAPVPEEARVWLADDESVWQPRAELVPLWELLRLTMLKSVWSVRCVARQGSRAGFTRSAAIAAFVREVRGLIRQDWATVEGDVRTMAGVPPSWFTGRDPTTTLAQFQEAWCVSGLLASVQPMAGAPHRHVLEVGLSVRSVPGHYVVEPG